MTKAFGFVLVVSAILTIAGAAQREPLAVVTDLRGDVTLQRAGEGEAKPLGYTALLYAGDALKTGRDGGATLFQRHAPAVSVAANQTVTLKPLPPSTRDDALATDLFASVVKHVGIAVKSWEEKSKEKRRGPNDLAVTALAPRHSLVLEPRPTFEWTPVADATSYKVTVYDSKYIIYQTTTKETKVNYPADRKPLAAGKYVWDVVAQSPVHKGLDTAPFTVATAPQAAAASRALARAAKLVSDKNATNLPYVVACLEHRLYPQAEAALNQAIQRMPKEDKHKDGTVLMLLMQTYKLMERGEDREKTRPISADSRRQTS